MNSRSRLIAALVRAAVFRGINGFNVVSPEHIPYDHFDPPLVMTNFQIFNQEVPIGTGKNGSSPLSADISETNQISLPYNSTVISFTFASSTILTRRRSGMRICWRL